MEEDEEGGGRWRMSICCVVIPEGKELKANKGEDGTTKQVNERKPGGEKRRKSGVKRLSSKKQRDRMVELLMLITADRSLK